MSLSLDKSPYLFEKQRRTSFSVHLSNEISQVGSLPLLCLWCLEHWLTNQVLYTRMSGRKGSKGGRNREANFLRLGVAGCGLWVS